MTAGEIPSGSVIITPDDMWKTIQETRDIAASTATAVNELKLIVNPTLSDIRADLQTLDDRENAHHNAHGVRLTDLERGVWSSRWVPAIFMAVICSSLAGVIVYAVTRLNM